MKKKDFSNFKKEFVYCETCDRTLPINHFSYSLIRINATSLRCKSCDWMYRNRRTIEENNYDYELIFNLVDYLMFKSGDLLKVSNLFEINLNDVIDIIRGIKINNINIYIPCNCVNCEKRIKLRVSEYSESKNHFCSKECYWKHKEKIVGVNHKDYKRINVFCSNCGKEINIIPYEYNKKNRFGESHNFCCNNCYYNFRSKYYVKEKNSRYGVELSDETKEKHALSLALQQTSISRFETSIQKIVNSILNELSIKYLREKNIAFYNVDNYITDKLIIEVMGDYWHTNPFIYNLNNKHINKTQYDRIKRDKSKHSYIKSHLDAEILYLWEYDIIHHLDVCKYLIEDYIKKCGKLPNYHSFNWHIENEKLHLNSNLIIPYQDMCTSEYKQLLA